MKEFKFEISLVINLKLGLALIKCFFGILGFFSKSSTEEDKVQVRNRWKL